MSWRLSGALIRLQGEVNDRHPGRAKQSDGTIGDPAHAARKSDHNPNADGIVMAWDVTGGPNGAAQSVVDHLERTRDPRIKYVIWQRRIMAGNAGPAPWTWRPYKGANPHDKHAHISVNSDDASPWGYGEAQTPPPIPKDDDMTPDELTAAIDKALAPIKADLAEIKRQVAKSEDATAKGGRTLRHIVASDLNNGG